MRTLISYLNQRPPAELKVIAEFWNADLTSRLFSGNAFELAKQISTEFLQRRVLEKLDRELVQILSLFLVRPDATTTLAELSRDAAKSVAETETLVKKLREFGLVYNDTVKIEAEEQILSPQPPARRRGSFGAPPSSALSLFKQKPVLIVPRELSRPFQRMLAERQSSGKLSNSPLARLLDRLEPEKLEGVAETWGIYGLQGSGTKQEYVTELSRAMGDTASQRKIIEELTPDSRELFEELKKRGRATTIPDLLKTYVSQRRLGRSLSPLTEILLVWEGFEDGQSMVWVPAEVAQAKNRPAEETQLTLQTVAEPTEATLFPPYALAWDILTFLNYILQNEVEVTNQSQIPKRHLKKLVQLFWKQEDVDNMPRSAFLINLTNSLDLVDRSLGDKKIQGGEELDHWLAMDLYDQMREIVDNWDSFTGFYGPFYLPFYYATPDSREMLIKSVKEWLRQCEPHVWYSLNSLIVKIEREQPFFIRSRKDMLNQYGAQRVQQILKQWPQVEGNIIRTLFDTALEWMGIVRVSRDKSGKVTAFSLTDLGAELVEVPSAVLQVFPETDKPLVALANFEIMLFVPQTITLMRLLQIAELKQLDKVSLFTLTRASVLKGLESGISPTKIIEFLEQNSAQPLPQNLIISIQDWSKGFKQARLRRVVLLESEDPAVLDELISSKQFAGVFAERLSPTAVLVTMEEPDPFSRADPLKSFRTKLRNSGISVR